MTDYKAIHGKNIQHLASDLDNAEGEGQIWFNTTSSDFKTIVKAAGSWATGGNLNQGRGNHAGAGTQTAGITMAGRHGTTRADLTETYDGSSWTEVADLSTGRDHYAAATAGTQTATLAAGGTTPSGTANSETWDGSSWTEGGNLPAAYGSMNGSGTATAALSMGGYTTAAVTTVNGYNGTSWSTDAADLNTARYQGGAMGIQTATIMFGGEPAITTTESYDGSSWTAVNSLNVARNMGEGAGTQALGLAMGNYPTTAIVETWDGSSWTVAAVMSTARDHTGSLGTGTAALAAGGNPGDIAATEEWDVSASIETVAFD